MHSLTAARKPSSCNGARLQRGRTFYVDHLAERKVSGVVVQVTADHPEQARMAKAA